MCNEGTFSIFIYQGRVLLKRVPLTPHQVRSNSSFVFMLLGFLSEKKQQNVTLSIMASVPFPDQNPWIHHYHYYPFPFKNMHSAPLKFLIIPGVPLRVLLPVTQNVYTLQNAMGFTYCSRDLKF